MNFTIEKNKRGQFVLHHEKRFIGRFATEKDAHSIAEGITSSIKQQSEYKAAFKKRMDAQQQSRLNPNSIKEKKPKTKNDLSHFGSNRGKVKRVKKSTQI